MPLLLDFSIHQAVERDGLPRVADYDDGSQHVLYLDEGLVRSMPVEQWAGALPSEPTPQESAAGERAKEAAAAERAARHAALRASIAGKRVDTLTLPELRALVELLAAGLLDAEGRVEG